MQMNADSAPIFVFICAAGKKLFLCQLLRHLLELLVRVHYHHAAVIAHDRLHIQLGHVSLPVNQLSSAGQYRPRRAVAGMQDQARIEIHGLVAALDWQGQQVQISIQLDRGSSSR